MHGLAMAIYLLVTVICEMRCCRQLRSACKQGLQISFLKQPLNTFRLPTDLGCEPWFLVSEVLCFVHLPSTSITSTTSLWLSVCYENHIIVYSFI